VTGCEKITHVDGIDRFALSRYPNSMRAPLRIGVMAFWAASARAETDTPAATGASCHDHADAAAPGAQLAMAHDHHEGHEGHEGSAPEVHDHATIPGSHHHHGDGTTITASLGVLAARYSQRLYEGNYQGAIAGARVAHGRFGLGASVPFYRLTKNGLTVDGVGDVMVHAHAMIYARGSIMAGAMGMVLLPTGSAREGTGMGHTMLMPELWAMWSGTRASVTLSTGFGYAMGGSGAHAEHGGIAPIVDPMNGVELTAGATVMYSVIRQLAVGARTATATPIGEGNNRLVGGVRIGWAAGRVETVAEVLGGVVGDPFGIRGLVETSIRFR
jgi:hypothetical protein